MRYPMNNTRLQNQLRYQENRILNTCQKGKKTPRGQKEVNRKGEQKEVKIKSINL
jgi:hypothetical protein